jgi:hypothetical protein
MTNVTADDPTQPEAAPLRPVPVKDVKGILKSELKRRGMTYADLVVKLADHGVVENEANLRNKISRGSFTAAFFVQCLIAIGCTFVQIKPGDRTPPAPTLDEV